MKTSLYPVIMSKDIQSEGTFFKELFDFQETFSTDWYISLISDGFELAIVDGTHETIPEDFRLKSQGVIINIEVDNVDEAYNKIMHRKDISVSLDIKSEDFGQRHFIIKSPSELMIDVIQIIPPTAEFADKYAESEIN